MNEQETFFNYRNYRWLWISLGTVIAMIGIYLFDSPVGGSNGGTVVGYTYGIIATVGIVYLMWYGIRKRSYHAKHTTLKGWLAAHTWIGLSLLIIVPLHSGFQFGVNVHTLAYLLMVIVIVSGIWGAVNYSSLAPLIQSHRGGGSHKQLITEIESTDNEIALLFERENKSKTFHALRDEADFPFDPNLWQYVLAHSRIFKSPRTLNREAAAEILAKLPQEEHEDGLEFIELINQKITLINQLQRDIAMLFWLRVWLCFHVPLSFALVTAVAIHIFVVLYYW